MLIQPDVIRVDEWDADEVWGLAYPEGARAKKLLISPEAPIWDGIRPTWRYLFKLSDRRYPEQFWGEIVAYLIGEMLGVPVPPAFVAHNAQTGECAALSEWFYEEGKAFFISAGSLFQQKRPDFDRKTGAQHNLIDAFSICSATVGWAKWREGIADMVLLDTLIGNSDRHQENWGFLIDRDGLNDDAMQFRFAPWFDNGTSLGADRWPERVVQWDDNRLEAYINRGCHHMRFSYENQIRIPHMALFTQFAQRSSIKSYLAEKLVRFDIDRLSAILTEYSEFDLPVMLSRERIDWMLRQLRLRYARMNEALN